MSFLSLKSYITTRLKDNFNTVPVLVENQDADVESANDAGFVYLQILNLDTTQASMGDVQNRKFRHTGIIKFLIYTQAAKGEGDGLNIADSIAALFRGVEFNSIRCYAPSLGRGEQATDDGKWWVIPLIVPFQHDADF